MKGFILSYEAAMAVYFFFLPSLLPSFLLLWDWHWGAVGKSPRLMPSKSFLKSHQSLQTHLCAFLCVYITSRDHAFHSPTSQCCPVAEVEILGSEILQVARFNFINWGLCYINNSQLLRVLEHYNNVVLFLLLILHWNNGVSTWVLPFQFNLMLTQTAVVPSGSL